MEKLVLTRKEACEAMGISMPVLSRYLNRERNPIPHFTTGRRIIIPAEAFREWLTDEAKRNAG